MYYEEYGKGEALVLIHGGGSTVGTNWGRVINDFARNHHVIAVELQAHGHTEDRGTPTSFEQDADDVSALLKHLKIDKADIFGFSNGASTTLQLAIRHPKQINKIIVASTFYKKTGAQPWFWGMMEKQLLLICRRHIKMHSKPSTPVQMHYTPCINVIQTGC